MLRLLRVQRAAWANGTSKVQGHLSFLLLLVPAALPQFPAPGGQFMSPWCVIHSSALKASPLPKPTSVAASHITSSSFSCSNPIWFALMQEKSCTKLLRNSPSGYFQLLQNCLKPYTKTSQCCFSPVLLFLASNSVAEVSLAPSHTPRAAGRRQQPLQP